MTHDEMITTLSSRLGWSEAKANELLKAATEVIGDHLSEPGTLSLPLLGELISRKKREYISLDPATGARYLCLLPLNSISASLPNSGSCLPKGEITEL